MQGVCCVAFLGWTNVLILLFYSVREQFSLMMLKLLLGLQWVGINIKNENLGIFICCFLRTNFDDCGEFFLINKENNLLNQTQSQLHHILNWFHIDEFLHLYQQFCILLLLTKILPLPLCGISSSDIRSIIIVDDQGDTLAPIADEFWRANIVIHFSLQLFFLDITQLFLSLFNLLALNRNLFTSLFPLTLCTSVLYFYQHKYHES